MNTSKKCARCLDSAEWKDGVLRCSQCGQMIALRYRIGEEVTIYTFQKFRENRKRIEGREDTYKITESGDLLGDISFKEFEDDLHNYIRPDTSDLFPIQEDEDWLCKDYKSEDSEGFRQINDLENENT